MKNVIERRSAGGFIDREVEEEKLECIIRAAMQAPSPGSEQPWEFIVVNDKDELCKISGMDENACVVGKASCAVVVLADMEKLPSPANWQQDMAASVHNMMLEAAYNCLGTAYVGVAPMDERMDFVIDYFDLPDNIMPYAIVAVGYPEGCCGLAEDFDSSRIHYNKW